MIKEHPAYWMMSQGLKSACDMTFAHPDDSPSRFAIVSHVKLTLDVRVDNRQLTLGISTRHLTHRYKIICMYFWSNIVK